MLVLLVHILYTLYCVYSLKSATKPDCDSEFAAKLDAAASKLRLNTDLRRRIFRAIVAAPDVQHAFEALVRLLLGECYA